MGKIDWVIPVKLICGLISNSEDYFIQARTRLEKDYGPVDFVSQVIPFTYTKYYEKEIGTNLLRQFISFEKIIDPVELSRIKVNTNNIENVMAVDGKRQINIDPGYITLAKLILATTKDRDHRIYLDNGIYAEITLHYTKKDFRPFSWTYPDYTTEEYIDIFNKIRLIFYQQYCKLEKSDIL